MALAGDLVKGLGPPLAVKRLIQSQCAPFQNNKKRKRTLIRSRSKDKTKAGLRVTGQNKKELRRLFSTGNWDRVTAAQTKHCLMLLGSPPDMVHRLTLRGTGPL